MPSEVPLLYRIVLAILFFFSFPYEVEYASLEVCEEVCCYLLVGVQIGIATLDIRMMISQKIRKQPSSRPSNTIFVYIPKGISIVPQGHVLNYIHSSIICHKQSLETTCMSLD